MKPGVGVGAQTLSFDVVVHLARIHQRSANRPMEQRLESQWAQRSAVPSITAPQAFGRMHPLPTGLGKSQPAEVLKGEDRIDVVELEWIVIRARTRVGDRYEGIASDLPLNV